MMHMKHGQIRNAKTQKQRMALMVPVLVIPFITFGFWMLGGGKASATDNTQPIREAGLNPRLPDPSKQHEAMMDKLGFYDAAAKDSIKRAQLLSHDPYAAWKEGNANVRNKNDLQSIVETTSGKYHQNTNSGLNPSMERGNNAGEAEQRLVSKMNELNRVIHEPQPAQNKYNHDKTNGTRGSDANASNVKHDNNTQHLEQLMQQMNRKENTAVPAKDPEVEQLNVLMDKVIAIQHPEKEAAKINSAEEAGKKKENILSVSNHASDDTIQNGFYGLNKGSSATKGKTANTIEATVPENQILVNNATIKLQLLQDLYVQSIKIPAGNFLWGKVTLSGERLNVDIDRIAYDHSLYPVRMEAYNTDGLPGMYVPGSITGDVMKQSADNSLQLMQLGSYDPSIGAQAAVAGIGAAKNLISKRVKLVKVTVKAGYKILLTNKTNG